MTRFGRQRGRHVKGSRRNTHKACVRECDAEGSGGGSFAHPALAANEHEPHAFADIVRSTEVVSAATSKVQPHCGSCALSQGIKDQRQGSIPRRRFEDLRDTYCILLHARRRRYCSLSAEKQRGHEKLHDTWWRRGGSSPWERRTGGAVSCLTSHGLRA